MNPKIRIIVLRQSKSYVTRTSKAQGVTREIISTALFIVTFNRYVGHKHLHSLEEITHIFEYVES